MPENDVRTSTHRYLATYINDHRGGAAGGLALARSCRDENRESPLGRELEEIADEIAEDDATLHGIADRLDIHVDPVKRAVAIVAERIRRLKFNGRPGYSPLDRLLELELLQSGIDAKRSLWRSLEAAALPALSSFDFDALAQRAASQHDRLVPHHRTAALEALVP